MIDADAQADLARIIDRLVDGGLSPSELRAAVVRLDAAPGGWKRCALAFLEAQCWSDVLRDEPRRPPAAPPVGLAPPTRPRPRPGRFRPGLAAAVLGAFALGWLVGGRSEQPEDGVVEPTRVAQAAPPEPPARAAAPLDEPDPPTFREVARLRFVAGPEDGPAAEVPVLAGPGLDAEWLLNQPMPVSEYEQAELERRGYALDQERELFAMPLADGRRVVVPVDQVQLRYVGAAPL